MPRRNLFLLFVAVVLAALCYQRPYLRVLAGAMARVERDALEPVTERDLFEGAMDGMLGQLDKHSIYLAPDKLEGFYEEIDQQFGGVGMMVAVDPGSRQLKVLCPLVDSPACRAGILAGDLIVRIDNKATRGMSLEKANSLLRGDPDTSLTLSILHEGAKEPRDVHIVRKIVQVESVEGDTRNADGSWNFFLPGHDHIAYVHVTSFTAATADELKRTLERLTARGMRGLVLDLRDNPGGYVQAGVDVCKLLIPPGVIVTVRDRDRTVREAHQADVRGPFADVPLAVLVNGDTASAAEIVAACLQDHHRAKIVGSRTYGKGTVQEVIELGQDYGAMKFTTASYWRPSGRNIQRPHERRAKGPWGVLPDAACQVALKPDELEAWRQWRARRDMFASVADLTPSPENPADAANDNAGADDADAAADDDDAETPAEKPKVIDPKKLKNFVDRQLRRAVECVEKPAHS